MVAESLGGWSDDTISIIQRVGHMLGQRLGVSPNISTRQLFQKLSVTLWRGNATLLLRRRHPGSLALDLHTNSFVFLFLFCCLLFCILSSVQFYIQLALLKFGCMFVPLFACVFS